MNENVNKIYIYNSIKFKNKKKQNKKKEKRKKIII